MIMKCFKGFNESRLSNKQYRFENYMFSSKFIISVQFNFFKQKIDKHEIIKRPL